MMKHKYCMDKQYRDFVAFVNGSAGWSGYCSG
jgi:hypothetical protein